MFLTPSHGEGTFHMGILSLAFRKKKEGQSVLASAVFQVSLTQMCSTAEDAQKEVLYLITSCYGAYIFIYK